MSYLLIDDRGEIVDAFDDLPSAEAEYWASTRRIAPHGGEVYLIECDDHGEPVGDAIEPRTESRMPFDVRAFDLGSLSFGIATMTAAPISKLDQHGTADLVTGGTIGHSAKVERLAGHGGRR